MGQTAHLTCAVITQTLPVEDPSKAGHSGSRLYAGQKLPAVVDQTIQPPTGQEIWDLSRDPIVHGCESLRVGCDTSKHPCIGPVVSPRHRSPQDASLHISVLELKAIRLALLHFSDQVANRSVLVRTNNISAKAYLNNQGGSQSSALQREAMKLLHWAESHLDSVGAEHIKGTTNIQVDWLSRQQILPGEWCLKRDPFQLVQGTFGPVAVDLFAFSSSHQLPRFFTRYWHRRTEGTDALISAWPQELLYAFLPIPLIAKLLQKIQHLRVSVIVVTPGWPWRPWFSTLRQLLVAPLLQLPYSPDMLIQGLVCYPHPEQWHLTAWRLSGEHS